jgi:hypothetical protein
MSEIIGNINIQSGIITGSYVLTYQICEKLNPANCDTATITINFQDTTPPIIAQCTLASTISHVFVKFCMQLLIHVVL